MYIRIYLKRVARRMSVVARGEICFVTQDDAAHTSRTVESPGQFSPSCRLGAFDGVEYVFMNDASDRSWLPCVCVCMCVCEREQSAEGEGRQPWVLFVYFHSKNHPETLRGQWHRAAWQELGPGPAGRGRRQEHASLL